MDYLTAWRAAERFYAEGFSFLFDNTSCVVRVFASSFLYLCLIFTAVDLFIFDIDCLSIMYLAYVHVPYINCLIISLN